MLLLNRKNLQPLMAETVVKHWALIPAEPLTEAADFLDRWLREKRHGSMQWLENHRELRRDPRQLMEDGRSILMIALPYSSRIPEAIGDRSGHPEQTRYRISRHVTETDYHHLVKEQLYDILRRLQNMDRDIRGRVFCDSAPVLEKELARRAGLGWIGKHSNLILPRAGSWFFLGGMLLNRDTDESPEQIPDHCGQCRKCQDACPTGALDSAYSLNAARCISYLTIENRDSVLPEHLQLQDWIYGCDICQEVCPWNLKFAADTHIQGMQPLISLQLRTKEEWEQTGEKTYKRITRRTAMSRQSYGNILRNIAHNRHQAETAEEAAAAMDRPERKRG